MTTLIGSMIIDTEVRISGEEGSWRGFVAPPGVAVYGKTHEEVLEKASKVSKFMMSVFEKKPDFPANLREYLEARGVEHEITLGVVPGAVMLGELTYSDPVTTETVERYSVNGKIKASA